MDVSASSALNTSVGSMATDLQSRRANTTDKEQEEDLTGDDESEDETFFRLKNRTYQCKFCSEIFRLMPNIQKHIKVKHPSESKTFKCGHCNRRFSSRRIRDNHAHFHSLNHQLKCTECDQMYRTKTRLEKHFQAFHDRNSHNFSMERFHCESCEMTFVEKKHHDLHSRIYHDKKPQSLKNLSDKIQVCERCVKTFDSRDLLMRHIRQTHQNDPPLQNYICKLCSKDLKKVTFLRTHILVIHFGIMPFVCQHCNAEFATRHWLLKHMEKDHSDVALFKCPSCFKSFTSESGMIKHQVKIHGYEPPIEKAFYKCGKCEKKLDSTKLFQQKRELLDHQNSLSDQCSQCQMRFNTKKSLQMTTYQDKTSLKCEDCGLLFRYRCRLQEHRKRHHSPTSTHSCPYCPKLFTNPSTQKRHIAAKHVQGEFIVNCAHCPVQFRSLRDTVQLRKHYKMVHPEERVSFKCPRCEKFYVNLLCFKQHYKKHKKGAGADNKADMNSTIESVEDGVMESDQTNDQTTDAEVVSIVIKEEAIVQSDPVEDVMKENDQNADEELVSIVIKEESIVQSGNAAASESAAARIKDSSFNTNAPSEQGVKIEIKQEPMDSGEASTSADLTEWGKSAAAEDDKAQPINTSEPIENGVKENNQNADGELVSIVVKEEAIVEIGNSAAPGLMATAGIKDNSLNFNELPKQRVKIEIKQEPVDSC